MKGWEEWGTGSGREGADGRAYYDIQVGGSAGGGGLAAQEG
jgi:hypothetical protein